MRASVLFTVVVLIPTSYADAQIPPIERDALVALYNSADGANWSNDRNWLGEVATVADAAGAFNPPPSILLASETKLLPPVTDQFGHDMLGANIALDGGTLVTSTASDFEAYDSSAAFVFQLDGSSWVHRATLRRDVDAYMHFLGPVAIDGSIAAVGATYDLNTAGVQTGVAYIFQDTSATGDWSSYSTIEIEASDGLEDDGFGWPLALWGRTLVVGGGGALYVFTDTSGAGDWSTFSEAKVKASDDTDLDSTDAEGAPGAAYADTIVTRNRFGDSVFVFRDASVSHDWSSHTEATLSIPDPGTPRDSNTIAIDGRTIVTGETRTIHTEFDQGSVYVFQDTSAPGDWSSYSVAEVFSSNTAAVAYLGWSVDVEGGVILAGAPAPYPAPPLAGIGAAYVFEDTSAAGDWSSYSETELVPPTVSIYDFFGFAVALEGSVAAVGAHYGEAEAVRDGFVDVFDGATGWSAEQRLTQAGIGDQERQQFGKRVVTDGTTVVVSAPFDDLDLLATGSLLIYQWQDGSWVERRQVVAAETLARDVFGEGLAFEPGRAFVRGNGSHLDEPGVEDVPAHLTVLTDSSATGDWGSYTEVTLPYDYASRLAPVAAGGRNAAIGDSEFDGLHEEQGVVRLFHDDSSGGDWSTVVETTITASYPRYGDHFGHSLALSGRVMLVGAPDRNSPPQEGGTAYLNVDTSAAADWSSFSETEIIAFDTASYDHFGSAVALADGWAAIGAAGDDDVRVDGGSVYILIDTSGDGSWTSYDIHKLVPPDSVLIADGVGFGYALAAWGRFLIVGAPSPGGLEQPGSAWVFVDTSAGADWSSTRWARLLPSDSAPGDTFGASVAVAGSTIVVGAPLHTEGELTLGAAYIFESALPGPDPGVELADLPDPVDPGEPLSFEALVTNHGSDNATDLELTVTFRPEVTVTAASGVDWTCVTSSGAASCTLDQLSAGLASMVTIGVIAPTDRGSVTATAVVTSASFDLDEANNTAVESTKVLGDMLFSDGFESGDLNAWDETPP
jgi:hypothetical protein